jgi:hypothetical protein
MIAGVRAPSKTFYALRLTQVQGADVKFVSLSGSRLSAGHVQELTGETYLAVQDASAVVCELVWAASVAGARGFSLDIETLHPFRGEWNCDVRVGEDTRAYGFDGAFDYQTETENPAITRLVETLAYQFGIEDGSELDGQWRLFVRLETGN